MDLYEIKACSACKGKSLKIGGKCMWCLGGGLECPPKEEGHEFDGFTNIAGIGRPYENGLLVMPKQSSTPIRDLHELDTKIRLELEHAGVQVSIADKTPDLGEVYTRVSGKLWGWHLKRAWRYWVVTTKKNGLIHENANKLHEFAGTLVRVNGHCGCPSPTDQNGDRPVTNYHIDSQDGLNAWAMAVRNQAYGLRMEREKVRVESILKARAELRERVRNEA